MRIPDEIIAEIRTKADIGDVISHYIPVINKGRSLKAICPFHDDHDPSLSISKDKQIYRCFVCGDGGNVFTFVQHYEKCDFKTAVYKVAEIIGFPLSLDYKESNLSFNKNEKLFNIMSEAINFTTFQLFALENKDYLSYLNDRGLNKEIIRNFQIGFNGPNNQLHKYLEAKGYLDSDMIKVNLINQSYDRIYDVFAERIMFPIHDDFGNPIAFTARSLDSNRPKYINTNDSELFHKGDVVYNYHRAKDFARKYHEIIVVEGVMDVIAFARCGIENVVATLGTSCTKAQIQKIKQLSENIVFCYDGDNAGIQATIKVLELCKDNDIEAMVINNETGLDPDEIIKNYSIEELISLSKQRVFYIEYLIKQLQLKYNLQNYSEKKQFAVLMYEKIAKLKDPIDQENFNYEIFNLTGFKNLVNNSIKVLPKKENKIYVPKVIGIQDGLINAQHLLLSQMLLSSQAVELYKKNLGFLPDRFCQKLAILIIDQYRKNQNIDISSFIDNIDDDKLKILLLEICSKEIFPNIFEVEVTNGAIRRILRAVTEQKLKIINDNLRKLNNPESISILNNEKKELLIKLRRYIDEEK